MSEPIEISTPCLRGNESKYLNECIVSNYVSSVGPFIKRFEDKVASQIGLNDGKAIATSSGTAALHLGLLACGVKPNDLVIIPTYTFIATANAISYLGAKPWIIDIELENLTLDSSSLSYELEKNTYQKNNETYHKLTNQKISCIVPVHVFGYPPNLDSLKKLAAHYSIPLLQDSACGIGSKYKDKKLGEMNSPGIISFNGNKTITSGAGGIFYSTNKELLDLVRHLSTTAKISAKYDHDRVGYNYKMSNIQAALGLAQVEQLEKILREKKIINEIYKKELNCLNFASLVKSPPWAQSSFWINAIKLEDKYWGKSKDLISFLKKLKINVNYFWKPLHLQTPYIDCLKSEFFKSDNIQNRIIALPSSSSLDNKAQSKIINSINSFFSNL